MSNSDWESFKRDPEIKGNSHSKENPHSKENLHFKPNCNGVIYLFKHFVIMNEYLINDSDGGINSEDNNLCDNNPKAMDNPCNPETMLENIIDF